MKRFLSLFLLLTTLFSVSCGAGIGVSASQSRVSGAPDSHRGFSELAARLLPAVVNISTEQTVDSDANSMGQQGFRFPGIPKGIFEEFFNNLEPLLVDPPKPRKVISLGSGFIVDKSGLIVTNYHVIANAKEIHVKFSDNSTARATVLGKDPKTDLAVLKVKTKKDLQPAKLGNSDNVLVGEWALAIGNPFGLGGSVSVGVISGRARDINIGTASEFLQTDAAINRGHSGGPLFNADGEVIGINTAIMSPQGGGNVGVAFAIPSNNAARVINVLSKGGKVEHGWLGVVIQHVTDDMTDSLGLEQARGALISSVAKDSPAEKAGLKVGDVILEFNGQKIDSMPQLTHLIAKTAVNEKAKMAVQRDGKVLNIVVTIGKLPDDAIPGSTDQEATDESVGLTVTNPPKSSKKQEGVLIIRVDHRSDAFGEGIRKGDILLGINSTAINNVSDFSKEMGKIKSSSGKGSSLLLLVKKGGGDSPPVYIPVKLNKNA
ncbi:Do family serine endopeptidase [Anaplasma capra]|uniref:Do family serine endopeptidase n=1 Tax=Anaplasma capra TaxID=1562740 RepID=UPI0021D5BFB1|nr:Do family serine endopeptidase [Anaplasma capra]MCU7611295.1 Do family serine endopeptidase [Anaplasma capra]MCU7612724.1 Do family serine endopeptidase [Anaplasma capra]